MLKLNLGVRLELGVNILVHLLVVNWLVVNWLKYIFSYEFEDKLCPKKVYFESLKLTDIQR